MCYDYYVIYCCYQMHFVCEFGISTVSVSIVIKPHKKSYKLSHALKQITLMLGKFHNFKVQALLYGAKKQLQPNQKIWTWIRGLCLFGMHNFPMLHVNVHWCALAFTYKLYK